MLDLTVHYHRLSRLAALLLLFIVAASLPAGSAELMEASSDAQSQVSSQVIASKINEMTKTSILDEGAKANLLELYRKSLSYLTTAASYDALSQKLAESLESAPVEVQRLQASIYLLKQHKRLQGEKSNISALEIEQQLLKAKTYYEGIKAEVATLTRQIDTLNDEPLKISKRLNEIQEREEQLLDALQSPLAETLSSHLGEAQRWLQQAELQALAGETRLLKQKLTGMPVLSELATVQQKEAAGRLEVAGSQVRSLEAEVNRNRQRDAAQSVGAAQDAMRQVANSPIVLQQAAAKNTELSNALQSVATTLKQVGTQKVALEKDLKRIEAGIKSTRQRLELAGLSKALGFLLHEQRRTLPDVHLLEKKQIKNQRLIVETGLMQLRTVEEQKQLDDPDGYITQLTVGLPPGELVAMEPELRKIIADRGGIVDKLFASNQIYLSTLSEIEIIYNQLVNAVSSFQNLLAERLLWIRSMPLFRFQELSHISQEVTLLFTSDQWLAAGTVLIAQADDSPLLIFVCLVAVTLLSYKKRMHVRLTRLIDRASHPTTYSFGQPLQALGIILLLDLFGPLLIFTMSWQLLHTEQPTAFSQGLAIGLFSLSYRLFLLRVLTTLLLPNGLAASFFRWPSTTTAVLRRESRWMMLIFLPIIFFTQMAFYANFSAGDTYALGRLLLVVSLGVVAVFFYRIFHPRTGLWQGFVKHHAEQALARLYPFFFFCVIFIPVMLIGLAMAGYVFAVGSLLRCLINSIWLILGLVLCHQLIERWLTQSSRQLFRKKAFLRHAQTKTNQTPGDTVGTKGSLLIEEPMEDLVELSTESRKLLHTAAFLAGAVGLWLVWAEVLPALRLLNEFTLWTYGTVINGQATVVPVSLADVGLIALIGTLTVTASRHFPALLNIGLLQHLEMPPGSRYTVTTLSRYVIGGTGVLVIADILGFSWSQIQWLVAALGVGIGFGLQEIVANFISGLIILFERPIRVGDVVTIGNTDGVVTRIRIRATTIRDFDGKELLVPNKEFIAGPLLNWSLSDPVSRIMLPLGIAYGSDVQAAMALMIEAAAENPLILVEPKSTVTFDSFGDNALLLTLRCFTGSVDDRVTAQSLLHQAIDRKFRETGISLAFPQRDVHLDTVKPLDIRIVQQDN